jgi:hypothetical protein
MAELPSAALVAIEDAVQAVVAADERRLAALGADSDLYVWTRDYGAHGDVKLVIPPGAPSEWPIDAVDVHDGTKNVEIGMWTREEGRSDLTLEIELRETEPEVWQARILNLHVL